jgi:integrase
LEAESIGPLLSEREGNAPGLATELAEQSVPLTVLQQQMRHADIKTTLRIYAHAIPQTQRDVMERFKGL